MRHWSPSDTLRNRLAAIAAQYMEQQAWAKADAFRLVDRMLAEMQKAKP